GEAEVALSQQSRPAYDYRDSLEIIYDEGRRLTRIVDDLFLLARADAGQRPLEYAELYLDEVVSDSVRAVRALAGRGAVRCGGDPWKELPFRGDELLLRRMIVNLLDNAIKHSPAGASVSVRTEECGAEYRVTVEDAGAGIPPEAQPLIFQRFFR